MPAGSANYNRYIGIKAGIYIVQNSARGTEFDHSIRKLQAAGF